MKMISERERAIGERLRVFRETLLIPRTRFAVQIGYGNERIASYEAGRAQLPYTVFKSIAAHFPISPIWLAEGIGEPTTRVIVDESFASRISPRSSFSEVYDAFISRGIGVHKIKSDDEVKKLSGFLRRFADTLNDNSKSSRIPPETIRFVQTSLMRLYQAMLAFDTSWNAEFGNPERKKKH